MPRNEQTKSSTLRSRQRITNKTRLRVVHGSIDAETVTIGEDDGRGALHSTQGVDSEDAAEHHLQQVLNASNNAANIPQKQQRPATADAATQATPASQAAAPPSDANFIPIPDAQGVVTNYDELYGHRKHEMSFAILKFSDLIEETVRFGLAGRSYTMDERDALWLENWNQVARGEGTSTGSTRRSRAKAGDAEEPVIDEDWFELCMGLFEKFSSEQLPYLHVDQSYPQFSFFEPMFLQPYSPSLFASFLVPQGLPDPKDLCVMARAIFPHWLERKKDRRGRSIIPDVNLDESDEGNVYVCFRRREVKPTRKTRRMETTSIDKLTRLSSEFQSALQLANKTIEREETKRKLCLEDHAIWTLRSRMVSVTSKFPDLRNADDDKWLVDKEKVKKPRPIVDTRMPLGNIRQPMSAIPQGLEDNFDFGPPQIHPRARNEDIRYKIEVTLQSKKEKEQIGWEDTTDAPLQHSSSPSAHSFRPLGESNQAEVGAVRTGNHVSAFRHRVGRGGRRYLDRQMSPFTTAPLPRRVPTKPITLPFGLPSLVPAMALRSSLFTAVPAVAKLDDNQLSNEIEEDLVKRMQDRWKFDSDALSAAGRPIIDDFDYRYSVQRHLLLKDKEYLVNVDPSKLAVDQKINFAAPLNDVLSVQGEHQMHQLQQASANGTVGQANATASLQQARPQLVNGVAVRPAISTQGLSQPSPLSAGTVNLQRQPQVAAVLLHQQILREKQAQAPAQAQPSSNGTPQPSPTQPQTPVQPQVLPQATTNGTPGMPVSSFVPLALPPQNVVNATPVQTSSPPKQMANGAYLPSPGPSPLPPSTGIVSPDPAATVRVSTPIRKSTIPLQPGGALPMNGFNPAQAGTLPNNFTGFPNGMSAEMYNNLQSMKLINQQHMLQFSHPPVNQLTPQQQYIQQQQQQQQQQQMRFQHQFQMMQAAAGAPLHIGLQNHFGDNTVPSPQSMMNGQQNGQVVPNPAMFAMGGPTMPNSAMNMTVQNMNLQLGPQNIALRMPPNRMQQQQAGVIPRPPTAMGMGDYGMGMPNGASPLMPTMQGMGVGMNPGVNVNAQMAAAMSISRAPSTPLSMRNAGLLPNGMMMGRSPVNNGPMQSPMMRPTSAASMHSNMGMQMPPGSLPHSLQNSPANLHQPPLTPHLRQQPVPGL